jgi:zinc protease
MKHKLILTTLCLVSLMGTQGFAQGTKETPPQGGPAKPFLLPKAETFTLRNGMKVTLVPYGSIPKVAVSAKLRSGNINETENQVWLADLTGDMLKEGTTTRSGSQIASEAASMGGQVSVGVGEDSTSIGGDVLSQFGPQFVALLADVIEHPAFPESELARLKASDLRQLTVARSQSGSLAAEAFRKTLYPNHPYGRLFPTEAMLSSYGINDIRKFYSDNYGASRVHLYVAGQYDAAAMRKAITDAFGEWQKGSPPVTNIATPVSARSIQLIDRPKSPQATVYIGLPVIAPGDPD